tara:strand:- start:1253 stop:1570 length:318 start_codon:yes stop_codon:yes gene_type:complete
MQKGPKDRGGSLSQFALAKDLSRLKATVEKLEHLQDKSFLLCPDCAKEGSTVSLFWVNSDQLSFGDYVEVRAEARCKMCDSYWQIKLPQMVRAQPQNRISNVEVF